MKDGENASKQKAKSSNSSNSNTKKSYCCRKYSFYNSWFSSNSLNGTEYVWNTVSIKLVGSKCRVVTKFIKRENAGLNSKKWKTTSKDFVAPIKQMDDKCYNNYNVN